MKQVSSYGLRHILSQSRSVVTYCPDVIEARFTKVCDVRSEWERSRVTPSVLTVSESFNSIWYSSACKVDAREQRESTQALPRTKQDCLRLVWFYGQTIETEPCIHG